MPPGQAWSSSSREGLIVEIIAAAARPIALGLGLFLQSIVKGEFETEPLGERRPAMSSQHSPLLGQRARLPNGHPTNPQPADQIPPSTRPARQSFRKSDPVATSGSSYHLKMMIRPHERMYNGVVGGRGGNHETRRHGGTEKNWFIRRKHLPSVLLQGLRITWPPEWPRDVARWRKPLG